MARNLSRRSFLKGGAAAAATLAASPLVLPQAVQASTGQELCTVLDLSKCIGCESCVDACREQWQDTVLVPQGPMPKPFPERVPIEDWSKKKDVQDRLTPYNFLYIEMLEIDYKGESRELNIPRRCMHCLNPPCVDLCPFGASRVEKNGVVHIDSEICLGGAKCRKVCPWHIPQRQSGVGIYLDLMPTLAGNGVMFKCHRCLPLVKEGKQPRCVEVCPEHVQSIGPRSQMLEKAEALARRMAKKDGAGEDKWKDYVYGLEENGGTSTIYVSPIPFAVVAKAIDKQHREIKQEEIARVAKKNPKKAKRMKKSNLGRPHMHRVADAMANAENLTYALALAPVAGVVAGFTKLFSKLNHTPSSEASSGQDKGGQA